jgi:protein-disulfide isomerase
MALLKHWKKSQQKPNTLAQLTPPVSKTDHVKGPNKAAVELVEYGDYQCPHCGAAHPVVKAIEKAYGKDLKFVFRNFPLSESHPYAEVAAMAAEAADRQDKFWQMHDMIFEHQRELSPDSLLVFAKSLKMNVAKLKKDMEDEKIAEKIELDFESGVRSGVNGTPGFFINGDRYNGFYDFKSMADTIETLIKRAASVPGD